LPFANQLLESIQSKKQALAAGNAPGAVASTDPLAIEAAKANPDVVSKFTSDLGRVA
jgi:hypothetical protein